jgi:NAD(P)-dependent dehydrogenase (short-subunit alcohol dehydrogenase family)
MRILITGSADGLGLAAAHSLLADGHDVIVHARNQDRATGLGELVERGAGLVVGDFTDCPRGLLRRNAARQLFETSSGPKPRGNGSSTRDRFGRLKKL